MKTTYTLKVHLIDIGIDSPGDRMAFVLEQLAGKVRGTTVKAHTMFKRNNGDTAVVVEVSEGKRAPTSKRKGSKR